MNHFHGRAVPRAGITTALTATALLLTAVPVAAHVSVEPQSAPRGGFSTLSFKVPNERDAAATNKLEISFPTDQPLASVMPQPVPGWEVKVSKEKLDKPVENHGEQIKEAVTKITWSGGRIEPGEFQQFPVSVGPLPERGERFVFKALQTYEAKDGEKGEVVRWIEEPEPGEKEPESPAPVLRLTAAADGHGASDSETAEDGEGTEDGESGASSGQAASDDGGDTTARVLGVIGIVTGVGGIAFGVLAGRRRTA
ncbi:DUF1775 domain-containing protein [Streptomyces sp. AJS327]|uniref:YcnI family copper-binding membrane protein n=1 Tax=Streptomyces sp. AJS327 TaxID=2545265 RepID=UPI0015DDFAE0|nr:YcnI family protein [Streptomyces sp. AJS327]MBA0052726.1 DUF1775 domain-containing protein [Streptomyces sp. AJS327]